MSTENKILISTIILGLIVLIFITYSTKTTTKDLNPFTNIKILNQEVKIDDNKKLYQNTIDCSNLHPNEQIISYNLKDNKNSKVSASVKVYKDNVLLIDDYKEATNIETRLIIKTSKREQIYIIESICQQGEIS